MKGIGYLLITTLKNRILSLRKKPAFLILYSIIILSVVFIIITSKKDPQSFTNLSFIDIRILYAIIAGAGLLYLFFFMTSGLSTGSTLFTMADVGLLFVSPISSKKILIYGLVKQMGSTLLSSFFILYQVAMLRQKFGLSFSDIFHLFIINAIILFFGQLLSIVIYVYSNGNPVRKNIIKGTFIVLCVVIIAGIFLLQLKDGGTLLTNLIKLMNVKLFHFVPVIGWGVMYFSAVIEGNVVSLIISLLLFFISSVIIIVLFTSGDADYYEDVLQSTEVFYARLQEAKSGKGVSYTKKIKIKKDQTGLKKGNGYQAIFYKHLLEKKRTSRFIFVDTFTVVATIGAGIASKYMDSETSVYFILGFLIYIQFFMTMFGKLAMELTRPYIYMLPETSLKKVLAASLTTIIKPFVDAVFIFTVVCIISRTSPLINLFIAIAYGSSGLFFTSFNLLCQRILGGQPNKLISAFVGFTLFFVLLGPGIGLSIAAIIMLPPSLTFLGTIPYTLFCIIISAIVFAACGNLLDKAECTMQQ